MQKYSGKHEFLLNIIPFISKWKPQQKKKRNKSSVIKLERFEIQRIYNLAELINCLPVYLIQQKFNSMLKGFTDHFIKIYLTYGLYFLIWFSL